MMTNKEEGIDLATFNKEEAIASFKGIDTQGFQLLVLLYIPPSTIKLPNGKEFYITSQTHEEFQYRACTGLVVQKGPESYDGERLTRVWCEVGDWIAFPRHEGIQIRVDGKPCQFLNDASVLAKIDDPRRIER